MSEIIARFVDVNACKHIFSEFNSTFVLRDLEHYWKPCGKGKEDRGEASVTYRNGGGGTTRKWLISCWTQLDGEEPTEEEWNIFEDSNAVAIISTPCRVSAFLEKSFIIENNSKIEKRYPFLFVGHGKVEYADKVSEPPRDGLIEKIVFTKAVRFMTEKEYRFGVPYSGTHLIDSYIFAGDPDKYADRFLANPNMSDAEKIKLLDIIATASGDYGPFSGKRPHEIIANADVLIDAQKRQTKQSLQPVKDKFFNA